MSDSNAPQITYQYFWVKIASKAEVNRQRAAGLTKEGDDYLRPQTVSVHPTPLRPVKTLAQAKLSVDIGAHIDMKEVEAHDSYVDIRILDGYDSPRALGWIETTEGTNWKGNAFCFLCHASVEFH